MDQPDPVPPLTRQAVFGESDLPDGVALLSEGKSLARHHSVGTSAFLSEVGAVCEADYKCRQAGSGKIMLHAQVGYRDAGKTKQACEEIHRRLRIAGYGVDRYGICLDWSMGYPPSRRDAMPRGTGLILDGTDRFIAVANAAPVAAHFGDFVMGMPASVENTQAALAAGASTIGNLGQYFTFRLPHWDDDVETTAATVRALALAAAQPVEVLIHSNLDDGFAALFRDLACSLGAVLLERYLVEDLIGGSVCHCYGHTFSDPVTRLAFHGALATISRAPGSMIYGNTTSYGPNTVENYAALASYLLVDIAAQRTRPSGHAINPVPVTEAQRIPEIDEIVEAHLFANRLIERSQDLTPLFDTDRVEAVAQRLVDGAQCFCESVLDGLAAADINTADPFELLLSLRRIGARRLEQLFGPGKIESDFRRRPLVPSTSISELEKQAEDCVTALDPAARRQLADMDLCACVATTDVHEYGKILLEVVFERLGITVLDAGVSSDPETVAARAAEGADFIALSTYNGVALTYLQRLRREMNERDVMLPVFIGGRLNQIPEDSNTSLPVDVSEDLRDHGAIPCSEPIELLSKLLEQDSENASQ